MIIDLSPNTKLILLFLMLGVLGMSAQVVPTTHFEVNDKGQAKLTVESSIDKYYILSVKHESNDPFNFHTVMALGTGDDLVITEPHNAYSPDQYQISEHSILVPVDTDGDGVDDVTEFLNSPTQAPLNATKPIPLADGVSIVDDFMTFINLSVTKDFVQWSEFLNGKGFVKFLILNNGPEKSETYFIDSKQHNLHSDFTNAVGLNVLGDNVLKGQIIYHPTVLANNGTLGAYTFNYSNGKGKDFDEVRLTYELLASNMPFLKNNLSYYITENNTEEYERDLELYDSSRIPIHFEADIYAGLNYLGLNEAEGFGFFNRIEGDETPDPRDIVLYESLPNYLPRVGGIISSVIQTPLSHVNLRAIQNGIPNAFIRDPLESELIVNLLGKYIYYKVEQDTFILREASLEEVNDWYEDIRPDEEQIPPLNLNYTEILPLADIEFIMNDGYGAKCANVATMHTFELEEETVPDGFGIPFYYYQEFMKHNGFFERISDIMDEDDFMNDRQLREELLNDFKDEIKDGEMPDWMLSDLSDMHSSFPTGTSVRCRSSTNNEDLPGFTGAGLYTSKTQHPEEGHISKSIKQVYASLWNLRAFDEREFYRVNHYVASMGILCHTNFKDEQANGVAVSTDPLYNTYNMYYLNTQVGEDLITNPSANSSPEELLIDRDSDNYIVIQYSSLVDDDSLVMENHYLDKLRAYLTIIHDNFKVLYGAESNESFAMDIEYKVTADGDFVIKQARPWVAFLPEDESSVGEIENRGMIIYPNPSVDVINMKCEKCNISSLSIYNNFGVEIISQAFSGNGSLPVSIGISGLPKGLYFLLAKKKNGVSVYDGQFLKM